MAADEVTKECDFSCPHQITDSCIDEDNDRIFYLLFAEIKSGLNDIEILDSKTMTKIGIVTHKITSMQQLIYLSHE